MELTARLKKAEAALERLLSQYDAEQSDPGGPEYGDRRAGPMWENPL